MSKINKTLQIALAVLLAAVGSGLAPNGTRAAAAAPSWLTVQTGGQHSCGLALDRRLWCWGDNRFGQLGLGTDIPTLAPAQVGTRAWQSVALGSFGTCALDGSRALWCWGATGLLAPGQSAQVPTPVSSASWRQVVVGGSHVCALKADDSLWCGGANSFGQLGDGSALTRTSLAQVGADSWQDIAAGDSHTCGLNRQRQMWCWGGNAFGQVGDGTRQDRRRPTRVDAGQSWTRVSGGGIGTCARQVNGSLWCWGFVGGPTGPTGRDRPVQIAGTWADFAVGNGHACGIKRGAAGAWCWGAWLTTNNPQANRQAAQPQLIERAAGWTSITVGGHRQCGLSADGQAHCWGDGNLGDGTEFDSVSFPTPQSLPGRWRSVSSSAGHICGIRPDDSLWCWGTNDFGQIGDGTRARRLAPVQIPGRWTTVQTGSTHTCGVQVGQSLWCWGVGPQVGLGDTGYHLRPEQVPGLWRALAGNREHTCGLKADDTLWCWGMGNNGQLGDGERLLKAVPVLVTGWRTWLTVAVGANHTCAIDRRQKLWCWGSNAQGRLGVAEPSGVKAVVTLPVSVEPEVDWAAVSGGLEGTCAVTAARTTLCWGGNSSGQLGSRLVRILPFGGSTFGAKATWSSVASGYATTCGIRSVGTLWCAGQNAQGQAGVRASGDPVRVLQQIGSATNWIAGSTGAERSCAVSTGGLAQCWGLLYGPYRVSTVSPSSG